MLTEILHQSVDEASTPDDPNSNPAGASGAGYESAELSHTFEYLHPDAAEQEFAIGLIEEIENKPLVRVGHALMQEDPDTLGHCRRTATALAILGYRLRLPRTELLAGAKAAELHDIGKLDPDVQTATRSPIRFQKGSAEREDMMRVTRRHVKIGAQMINQLAAEVGDEDGAAVAEIEEGHHIYSREDTYGTPPRRFQRITECLALVDELDALASSRGYKPAMTKEETRATLEAQFSGDPELINICFDR